MYARSIGSPCQGIGSLALDVNVVARKAMQRNGRRMMAYFRVRGSRMFSKIVVEIARNV